MSNYSEKELKRNKIAKEIINLQRSIDRLLERTNSGLNNQAKAKNKYLILVSKHEAKKKEWMSIQESINKEKEV